MEKKKIAKRLMRVAMDLAELEDTIPEPSIEADELDELEDVIPEPTFDAEDDMTMDGDETNVEPTSDTVEVDDAVDVADACDKNADAVETTTSADVDETTDGDNDVEIDEPDQAVVASKQLKKLARVIYNKRQPLTASQKKLLQAKLLKVAKLLKGADDDAETELKKMDIVKSVGRGFVKNGPLRTKIDWRDLRNKGIDPTTKLKDLQLNDLRYILTKVRGIGG